MANSGQSSARVSLELPIEEDVAQELADFTYLAKRGRFREARTLFERTLEPHKYIFPVAAEFIDCLLQQSDYDTLEKVLYELAVRLPTQFSEQEVWFLKLARAICGLYRHGDLPGTLWAARRWHEQAPLNCDDFTSTMIHTLELYLGIVVFAYNNSDWVENADTRPPWGGNGENWLGFVELGWTLFDDGRYEEAQRFNKLMLMTLPVEYSVNLVTSIMFMYSERLAQIPATDTNTRDSIQLAIFDAGVAAWASQLPLYRAPPLIRTDSSTSSFEGYGLSGPVSRLFIAVWARLETMSNTTENFSRSRQRREYELLKLMHKRILHKTAVQDTDTPQLELIEEETQAEMDFSLWFCCLRLRLRTAQRRDWLVAHSWRPSSYLTLLDAMSSELVYLMDRDLGLKVVSAPFRYEFERLLERLRERFQDHGLRVPAIDYDTRRVHAALVTRKAKGRVDESAWATIQSEISLPEGWQLNLKSPRTRMPFLGNPDGMQEIQYSRHDLITLYGSANLARSHSLEPGSQSPFLVPSGSIFYIPDTSASTRPPEYRPHEGKTLTGKFDPSVSTGASSVGTHPPPPRTDHGATELLGDFQYLTSSLSIGGTNPELDLHFAALPPSRWRSFFKIGRVFAITLFQSDSSAERRSKSSFGQPNQAVIAGSLEFRRVIRIVVISVVHDHCRVLQIHTYGGQGLKKPGFNQKNIAAHAIIHNTDQRPTLLTGEPQMVKRPIEVQPSGGSVVLDSASRIDFQKIWAVEMNQKVLDVGMVTQRSLPFLERYYVETIMGKPLKFDRE